MRSIFTFTIAGLILTACSQTPASVTSTPPPSTPPTRISTVTPTFFPTFTSTPPAPDQLAEMTLEQKLDRAPDEDGFTKTQSPVRNEVILYSQGGAVEKAYSLLTGELTDVIDISTSPDKPTPVTMEDLTSGKLAVSEKLLCAPFGEGVIAGDWEESDYIDENEGAGLMGRGDFASDPSIRPQQICSFSSLMIDLGRGVQEYILIGVPVYNADGTVGAIHVPARPEHIQKFINGRSDYSINIMTDSHKDTPTYPEANNILSMYDDWEQLEKELVASDVLPREFETRLITITGQPWG